MMNQNAGIQVSIWAIYVSGKLYRKNYLVKYYYTGFKQYKRQNSSCQREKDKSDSGSQKNYID